MEPDREILTAYSESAHQITYETAKIMLVTKLLLTSVIIYIFQKILQNVLLTTCEVILLDYHSPLSFDIPYT